METFIALPWAAPSLPGATSGLTWGERQAGEDERRLVGDLARSRGDGGLSWKGESLGFGVQHREIRSPAFRICWAIQQSHVAEADETDSSGQS